MTDFESDYIHDLLLRKAEMMESMNKIEWELYNINRQHVPICTPKPTAYGDIVSP